MTPPRRHRQRAGMTDYPDKQQLAGTAPDVPRALRLAMRIGVAMLRSGAETDDVEESILAVASVLGVPGVQAAVTFSMISISEDGPSQPTTLLHFVRDRTVEFDRLAATASVV